ncbi:hypothetical protein [Algoriphagus boritolerans]|uniref:hypothetical protein n=1 Tax=Algoriphagus boritolerans TaxID=308111 RepID=UPI000AC27EC9
MIKYQIKNKEVIITDTYITYGKDSIKYDDIIDFEFSHQYVNFVGGIDFTLIGKNNSIWISVSASNSFLQRTSTTENIEKVQEIVNLVLPKALNGFIRHNFSELSNGGTVKIWKLIFEKKQSINAPSNFILDQNCRSDVF